MGDYRQLDTWKSAQQLAVATYRLTSGLPNQERFGLGDQMRRASVSVASNIAEGAARETNREFARFVRIARGSLQELLTQIVIAAELDLVPEAALKDLDAQAEQTGRLLSACFGTAPRTTTGRSARLHAPRPINQKPAIAGELSVRGVVDRPLSIRRRTEVSAPPFFDLPLFPGILLSVLYKAMDVPEWSKVSSHKSTTSYEAAPCSRPTGTSVKKMDNI
jgi:four helix bundle protein